MAKFTVSKDFRVETNRLRGAVALAAEEAVGKAIFMAAQDAKAQKRWNDQGKASFTDAEDNTWEWEVSGLAEEALAAYVVTPKKRLPSTLRAFSKPSTNVYINGRHVFTKKHRTRPPSMRQRQTDKVTGVLTLYAEYTRWLQLQETRGSKSGDIAAGEPITIDIIKRRWRGFYIPAVVRPTLEQLLRRL